jgi:proteasome lid subunit RPN8/RPN11
MITGAIEAISADEQRATLTFTQDSWEYVHNVMDKRFPNDEIVGWYHSHPNFGIFLSDHDLFIHRNFFDAPSQIALVVDPCNCTEGVFVWNADGDIQKLYERPTPKGWEAPALEPIESIVPDPVAQAPSLRAASNPAGIGSLTEGQTMGYAAAGIGGILLGLVLAMVFSVGATTTTTTETFLVRPVGERSRSDHPRANTTTASKSTTSSATTTSSVTTTSSATTTKTGPKSSGLTVTVGQ